MAAVAAAPDLDLREIEGTMHMHTHPAPHRDVATFTAQATLDFEGA